MTLTILNLLVKQIFFYWQTSMFILLTLVLDAKDKVQF